MIIKRKLFTFQDRKVFRELHRATNGFRELPKGYKNLTPRDVFRLSNVAGGYEAVRSGNLGGINYDELRTLATHLDLPETAKGAEHLIKKYNNPELLERYNRIKTAQKIKKLSPKQKKNLEALQKLDKEYKKLKKAYDSAENAKYGHETDFTKLDSLDEYNRLSARLKKAKRNLANWEDNNIEEYNNLTYRVSKYFDEPMTPFEKLLKKRSMNGQKSILKKYKKTAMSSPALAQELVDDAKAHGLKFETLKNSDPEGSYINHFTGTIGLLKRHVADPAIIGHEFGHSLHVNRLSRLRKEQPINTVKAYGGLGMFGPQNPVYSLGDEYGASASALARMKLKRSATPLEIANAEKELTGAYKSYYYDTIYNGVDSIKYRLINPQGIPTGHI